jgi:hypothetical protein
MVTLHVAKYQQFEKKINDVISLLPSAAFPQAV